MTGDDASHKNNMLSEPESAKGGEDLSGSLPIQFQHDMRMSGGHGRRSTLLPDQRGSIGRASIDTANDELFVIYDSMEIKGQQQNSKILMQEYSG